MREDRLMILKMLKEGKITVEEAAALLQALEESAREEERSERKAERPFEEKEWPWHLEEEVSSIVRQALRAVPDSIQDALRAVREGMTGAKVGVSITEIVRGLFAADSASADIVLRFLPKGVRFVANGQEVDLMRFLAALRNSGTVGKIVDITDHKGTRIEITVE
ncbi:MAG: hypothetical protein QN189_01775 [Armatimonadota bacterium]|nr:hypothetical protein [Armatimonadota bacterium]